MTTKILTAHDHGGVAAIIGLPDPSNSGDAATMGWVRQYVSGVSIRGDTTELPSDSIDLTDDNYSQEIQ